MNRVLNSMGQPLRRAAHPACSLDGTKRRRIGMLLVILLIGLQLSAISRSHRFHCSDVPQAYDATVSDVAPAPARISSREWLADRGTARSTPSWECVAVAGPDSHCASDFAAAPDVFSLWHALMRRLVEAAAQRPTGDPA